MRAVCEGVGPGDGWRLTCSGTACRGSGVVWGEGLCQLDDGSGILWFDVGGCMAMFCMFLAFLVEQLPEVIVSPGQQL